MDITETNEAPGEVFDADMLTCAVVRRSPFSGKTHKATVAITVEQYRRWKSGVVIQNAFPHLSVDEREFIKTSITPAEWEKYLG